MGAITDSAMCARVKFSRRNARTSSAVMSSYISGKRYGSYPWNRPSAMDTAMDSKAFSSRSAAPKLALTIRL